MKPIPKRMRTRSGQALIEFSLVLPLLFLLIVNVINFGAMMYAWICVSNASRAGVQYYITSGASVGAPAPPSPAAVQTLVGNDLHPLPNSANAQVCVALSTSVSWNCTPSATAPATLPAADSGEGSPAIVYPVGAVDVSYPYQPLIPLWSFSRLGIRATLPPTTVHRRAVMRVLQ
jgi:Flp pilus assembly protein TadG